MDDFTNDGQFDPDLEGRLYGEIYYSNDTFPEPPLRFWNNTTLNRRVNQPYIPQNNYSNQNHAHNNGIDRTSYVWMTHQAFPTRFHDFRSGPSTSNRENLPSYQYPASFTRGHNHKDNFSNSNYSNQYRNYYYPNFNHAYRQPSHKRTQDYQPVVASYKSRRSNYSRNLSVKGTSSRRRKSDYSKTQNNRELSRVSPQKENNSNEKSLDSVVEIVDTTLGGNIENSDVAECNTSTNDTTSVVIDENIISNNDNENKNIDNEVNSTHHCSDTASKYNVKEKQMQVDLSDITNMDNDIINCSDSEESIFEVPVPPKPKPPLIDIQDSDDSSGAEEIEEYEKEEEEENPIIVDNIDESTSDSSPVTLDLNVQNNRQTVDLNNIENIEKESTDINIDENNIILNCVALQKCASNLGDIRRIRDAAIVSDDSMTDSEALNWGTIEGQIIQDNQPIPDDDSNQGHFNINYFEKPHNKERVQDTSDSTCLDKTPTRKSTQVSNSKQPISEPVHILESPSCSKDNQDINVIINCNTGESTVEIGTSSPICRSEKYKKRSHRLIENNNQVNINDRDHQEPSTSAKKPKTSSKSTAEMSFEEYVFQPMSEKLKEYYGAFSGEDFMNDVSSIQNQMPKNPSRWAILDIDLYGPRRWDKHLRCAICQNFGHRKDKCPAYKQVIVCYMCGEQGHTEPRCPYKMCLTCGTKYSTYRKTCENCRNLMCTTCKSQGHSNTNCPDLWRRFHQTTDSHSVNAPLNPEALLKTPNKLACCNCTKRGHESTTCQRYRWSQHFPTPRFVTNYDQPPFYTQNSEISTSTETGEILYHDTNYSNNILSIEWVTEEIYPHTLTGVSYSFTEEYLPTPAFLKKHIPSDVYYDLTISRLSNSYHCVFLVKSINNELLCGIKKLIIQWLQRTHEDRSLMDSTTKLPVMQIDLIDTLNSKWMIFNQIGFKKIRFAFDATIMNGEKELMKMEKIDKLSDKQLTRQKSLRKKLPLLKKRLLAYIYRLSLIPDAENILEQFPKLIDKLKKYPALAPVPNDLYLNATWFYFELFIPHASGYLLAAFQEGFRGDHRKWKVERKKLRKIRDKQLSKNRDIQVIDLTETDQDTSINITGLNKKAKRTPQRKSLRLQTSSEQNLNRTENVKKKLKSMSNNISSNKNDLMNCQQQMKCAGEILKFVRKRNLKNFIQGANRLVKEAEMSLLRKEHILHFWTLIRSSKNN